MKGLSRKWISHVSETAINRLCRAFEEFTTTPLKKPAFEAQPYRRNWGPVSASQWSSKKYWWVKQVGLWKEKAGVVSEPQDQLPSPPPHSVHTRSQLLPTLKSREEKQVKKKKFENKDLIWPRLLISVSILHKIFVSFVFSKDRKEGVTRIWFRKTSKKIQSFMTIKSVKTENQIIPRSGSKLYCFPVKKVNSLAKMAALGHLGPVNLYIQLKLSVLWPDWPPSGAQIPPHSFPSQGAFFTLFYWLDCPPLNLSKPIPLGFSLNVTLWNALCDIYLPLQLVTTMNFPRSGFPLHPHILIQYLIHSIDSINGQ